MVNDMHGTSAYSILLVCALIETLLLCVKRVTHTSKLTTTYVFASENDTYVRGSLEQHTVKM